jgi:hypothetical protein
MRCEHYRLSVKMETKGGYNHINHSSITTYAGEKYQHNDEQLHLKRRNILKLLKDKKLHKPTEKEIRRKELDIKRQLAEQWENESAARELKELREKFLKEKEESLKAPDLSLVKSMPNR